MGFEAQIRIYQMDEVGKDFKQWKQGQRYGDRNKCAIWGLLQMGKPEAQIKCRGGWEKVPGVRPSWVLLHRRGGELEACRGGKLEAWGWVEGNNQIGVLGRSHRV